jgi:small conductance mechanosensitive channel
VKPLATDGAVSFDTVALLIKIGLILGCAFLFSRVAAVLIGRIERAIRDDARGLAIEREKRAKTLGQVLRSASWILIVVVAALMAVRELGLDISPALAAAGGFGVAAGLGAQTLVRDWIAGFFIILDNQFSVGDVIRAAGVAGKVENLSLRHTELRDGDGALHFIPNSEMKVVTNLSKSWSQPTIRLPVNVGEDPKRVLAALESMLHEFAADPSVKPHLEGDPKVLGIEDVHPGYYTVLLQVRTNPGRRLEVGRALRGAALARLRREGISVRPTSEVAEGTP